MKNKMRISALERIAKQDEDYSLENLRKRGAKRSKKIVDNYKNISPVENARTISNEKYDIETTGMSQEEKEVLAEEKVRKKRKEAGLE